MSSSSELPATGWVCFTADSAWANKFEILDVMRNNSVEGNFEMPMTTVDGLTWYTDMYQLSTAFTTLAYYKPFCMEIGNGQTESDLRTPRLVDSRYCEPAWVTSMPKITLQFTEATTTVRVLIPTDTAEFSQATEPAEWVDTDDDDAETDDRSRKARADKRSVTVARAVKMHMDEERIITSCADDPKCEIPAKVWIGETAHDAELWIDEVLVASCAVNGN
jgi:hypothetical protein